MVYHTEKFVHTKLFILNFHIQLLVADSIKEIHLLSIIQME